MLRAVVDAVLPAVCPGCGALGAPVCDGCAGELQLAAPGAVPVGLDALAAVFAYDGVARELVARVKYRNARAAVGWLADAMTARAGPPVVDVVTWAPTTPARRRARGFDHAELLARAVASRRRLPRRRLLVRRPGPPQTGAGRDARGDGPRFVATPAAAGRAVLLVDDVVTTGATLSAAAAALRRAGAPAVFGLVAARTPERPLTRR
jgi:predicted amidophosphoribosyltransferase